MEIYAHDFIICLDFREIFRLPLFHYQEWFEEAMVYWLQTFKTECISRMEKALEIDKDVRHHLLISGSRIPMLP